jgi:hypothetical protein
LVAFVPAHRLEEVERKKSRIVQEMADPSKVDVGLSLG